MNSQNQVVYSSQPSLNQNPSYQSSLNKNTSSQNAYDNLNLTDLQKLIKLRSQFATQYAKALRNPEAFDKELQDAKTKIEGKEVKKTPEKIENTIIEEPELPTKEGEELPPVEVHPEGSDTGNIELY